MNDTSPTTRPEPDADPARSAAPAEPRPRQRWELLEERRPPGLVRRFFATLRHLMALLAGARVDAVRRVPPSRRRGLAFRRRQFGAFFLRLWLDRSLRGEPFAVQFRRRLQRLGPTYIKLGQALSLREDLLPPEMTRELVKLFDQLPVVPFPRFAELVTESLGRPLDEMFSWVDPEPAASASIAQLHRATTRQGEGVILKVVKPGIRETLARDAILLSAFGTLLHLVVPRYRPRRVIRELVALTRREVDLAREADNAETFAANFKDTPDVVFPRIYRAYSSDTVLCMEYLSGHKPTDHVVLALPEAERKRLVELGAGAIIRMLYEHGFFHADLHPGNLLVLAGPRCGFVDLGLVGYFEEELRRTLLYYYYCLVMGDAEHASRYLLSVAEPGRRADPAGFRREVQEVVRRWQNAGNSADYSLGRLVLESLSRAARYHYYFPLEMVLMVKALITFESVGQILQPNLDIAAFSRSHVHRIFMRKLSPLHLTEASLTGGPEVVDALVKVPMLVTEGLKVLEQATRQPAENPFAGIRGTLFAGFCLLAGAILGTGAMLVPAPFLWLPAGLLWGISIALAMRRGP